MADFTSQFHPVVQALLATLFAWGVTALGAATVFNTRTVNQRILDGLLGFAAGVMIAASYWSLLAPSIEMAERLAVPNWFPAVVGFVLGAAFLRLVDALLPPVRIDFIFVTATSRRSKHTSVATAAPTTTQ